MSGFSPAVLAAAAREREVGLTTFGRRSGAPGRVTIWVSPSADGQRLFIRSGQGLRRDWPQNLLASGRGVLHVGGFDVPVAARHVTDPAEARAVTELVAAKYGAAADRAAPGAPPPPAESATFELVPDPA